MIEPADDTPSFWSPMKIGGAIATGLLLLLLIPTLRSPSKMSGPQKTGGVEAEDVSRSQCERTLVSAIDGLQPTRLGLSSESRVMVDTLNNWLTQCVDESTPVVSKSDEQLRQKLLTPEGFARSQSARFQLRDADHVRNSLLASAIVDRVTAGLRSDHDRALALFYYVVRTLDLVRDDGPILPLTPYESLVFGLGTAADRAWTYSLLMRQLRLDVVMIQPQSDEDTPYWILGAIVPGAGVLLLDPRLGLPITTLTDSQQPQTALPARAATLSDARQDDALLRQFDREERKYPLSAADLAKVDVFAIGASSALAPRMGRLQMALPEAVELYDGLTSNELREEGLFDRIAAAGQDGLWTSSQVRVWPFPESRWADLSTRSEDQRQQIDGMYAVLSGPAAITIDLQFSEQDQLLLGPVVEPPQRTLLMGRIEQLLGDFATAQQIYLQVRLNHVNLRQVEEYLKSVQETLAEQGESPEQLQQTMRTIQQQILQQVDQIMQGLPAVPLNVLAADMATYWAAQSHYEQQDYRLAAESAQSYIQRVAGKFLMPAIYLASLSLAQDQRPDEAIRLHDDRPAEAKPSPGFQSLIDRWRKLAGGSETDSTQSAEDTSQKPADGSAPPPTKESPDQSLPPDKEESDPSDANDSSTPSGDGSPAADRPATDPASAAPSTESTDMPQQEPPDASDSADSQPPSDE